MNELHVDLFSDGSWVIVGDHVDIINAQEIMDREDDYQVVGVQHFWVRRECAGEELASELDLEIEDPIWILYETEKKPKGVFRKATVLIVEDV